MITGREPNIRRCLAPEVRAKELAAQRKAELEYCAKVEKTEQKLFSKWLKDLRQKGKLYWINPRSDKPSTIEPGHPDYTIWIKGIPQPVLIEMKVAGGELASDQVLVIGELEALGQHVYVAWNHVQAENIIQFYLSVSLATQRKNDNRTVAGQAASQERTQGMATERDVQATTSCGTAAGDVARTLRADSTNGNVP
jgi:hypothetical protein